MRYLKLYENFNKSDIHEICEKFNIENYTINKDGSIDVEDEVNLFSKELTKLPLKFRNISGDFYCNYNNLTTLEGCPKSVGGNFYCNYNRLTSLEGCPKSVSDNFLCSNNILISLEYCPESVGGDFYCDHNELTSLEYCTNSVNNFNCSANNLTSLEFCPKSIRGNFYTTNNKLTSLKFMPYIKSDFVFDNNKIRNFKYFTEPSGEINCIFNPIYQIWKLFTDTSYIELLNDYDCIRGEDIVIDRFNEFLEEIDKPTVKSVEGYNNI